jgi:NitT/TauT family transport system ATP-binding protein
VTARGAQPAPAAPCIWLDAVGVTYQTRNQAVEALAGVELSVGTGELVALLGPTGCGKSTLLRVVSDLTPPSAGRVEVRGAPAASARRANEFGFVFQEAALLPWRSALENVRLPLEVVSYPPQERRGCSTWSDCSGSATTTRTSFPAG